ncbi:hypothetical protein FA15DRAFT_595059 [Coprinopsis marcescibilis]|uniref:Cation-transporting P-type ATPase N-terminal domain-containing protein n=1 Tax=Coprinopsis marcescibilis TaxID=230819 RepID=A0A5C3KR44_COPMA|nr:hypothetical protein FA15DRAFT_595059 [Coprinopsis marcescibilis]
MLRSLEIQLRDEDLYDKEIVDLETIAISDVLQVLQCDENGLSREEAKRRLRIFGPNQFRAATQNPVLQLLSFVWNPLAWAMEAAVVAAIIPSNGQLRTLAHCQHFRFIIPLLFINSAIGSYEEWNAENAEEGFVSGLPPQTAIVLRDNAWIQIESAYLVPGDIVSFKAGETVPADCRLLEAINVSIDQASLTGESLLQSKKEGDQCFLGSVCKQGEVVGVVISTGGNTFLGRFLTLLGTCDDDTTGRLEEIIAYISLVIMNIFMIGDLFNLDLDAGFRYQYCRTLSNIVDLITGRVHNGISTTSTFIVIIINFVIVKAIIHLVTLLVNAAHWLDEYKASITHLTAIGDLAGIIILCDGKARTNDSTIDRNTINTISHLSADEVILLAACVSHSKNPNHTDSGVASVDTAVFRRGITLLDFKPFNLADERTEITYREELTGKLNRVTIGLAGTILELCTQNKTNQLEKEVEDYAQNGLQVFAIAYAELQGRSNGNGFELIGLLANFDPPREPGVKVKVGASDQPTASENSGLGKFKNLYEMTMNAGPGSSATLADVFANDKSQIVRQLQALGDLFPKTGDGTSSKPNLSRMRGGIAVEGVVNIDRHAADTVLAELGLSTIFYAIRQSPNVIQCMRSYSIYACTAMICTVVCFTILAFTRELGISPFTVLLVALSLQEGASMALSLNRPMSTSDTWRLAGVLAYYATAFRHYPTVSA